MRRHHVIVLTVAAAALLYLSFGLGVGEFLEGARARLSPGVDTEVEVRAPEEIGVVLGGLEALPVPGFRRGPDEGPSLGEVSKAAAGCVLEMAPGAAPPPQAREALRRYLLLLGAIGTRPDAPLLEPRFAALSPLLAEGPGEALRSVAEGDLAERERELLADYHETYRQPRHPLYLDLELHADTFPELSFQALLGTLAEDPEAVADCAFDAALGAAAEMPPGEVLWDCERLDEPFGLTSTLMPGQPAALRLARAGARADDVEEGRQVETDRGLRFEGDGWAFWSVGRAALLELPDGTTAACTRAEDG